MTGIHGSVWLYRRLLGLYPAGFRDAFSEAAASDFADLCVDMFRRRGFLGLTTAWHLLLRDLVVSLTFEWIAAGVVWQIVSFVGAALIYAGIFLGIEPGIRCR